MQNALFDEDPQPEKQPAQKARRSAVQPCEHAAEYAQLAQQLPPRLYMGCSSWSYPDWQGIVWQQAYSEQKLSKEGLHAYAQHPLLSAVCIDRTFYRPLTVKQYADYAAQVHDGFRFVVKAPAIVTDPMMRDEGKALQANPAFLNAQIATEEFITPAVQGLRHKLGVLVFQISPLPVQMLAQIPALIEQLRGFLLALPAIDTLRQQAPDVVIAVEVRDRQWLTLAFAHMLRDVGAAYCLGLHAKMPPIQNQLPILRTLWPSPLVARWNLNPIHGAYGYEQARKDYSPYTRLHDIDLPTRETLAKLIKATTDKGLPAYVTVSNKAEGCAPLSVAGLLKIFAKSR